MLVVVFFGCSSEIETFFFSKKIDFHYIFSSFYVRWSAMQRLRCISSNAKLRLAFVRIFVNWLKTYIQHLRAIKLII